MVLGNRQDLIWVSGKAIISGFHGHPLDGYRRLTHLLMVVDKVGVCATTT